MKKTIILIAFVLVQLQLWAQVPNISYSSPQSYTVGTVISPLAPTNTGGAILFNEVTTLAGKTPGQDGTGTDAVFANPNGVAVDVSGNVYVADTYNHKIRKITPAGVVTTLAGSGNYGSTDGTGTAASFNGPVGVVVDASGTIYVADSGNHKIRKITPAGVVTTLAGSGTSGSTNGTGTAASFYYPTGVAVDASGNVYVADQSNHKIRKITPAGVVTTLAGSGTFGSTNGTGTAASFASPRGVAVDASGNVYVADFGNHKIRKITPAGVVTTLAGSGTSGSTNGTGTAASFNGPNGVAVDASGTIYVADSGNHKIRKITPAGVVTTLAGSGTVGSTDATGTTASFAYPYGVAVDASGNVYVADQSNHKIRKITPAGVVTTLAGSGTSGATDGTGTTASFNSPRGVAVDASGNLYVADTYNHKIRKITPAGVVTTLAGSGTSGSTDGTGTAASFAFPRGVAVDASGNVYVADSENHKIRKITPAGVVTTLAGSGNYGSTDGTGTAASFNNPVGVVVDASGTIYVADSGNNKIRKITPAGVVTTLAGSGTFGSTDGTGTTASFAFPRGVTVDASGNVYVGDTYNHNIRKITPAGVVTTLAGSGTSGSTDGTGTAASFAYPYGVAVDASGNVYVADTDNHKIRKITPAGVVTTLAGSGNYGSTNGTGTAASFNGPYGVAVDASGNVYVADSQNHKIRKITPTGYTITPSLPAGLSFDAATGTITGTPTVVSLLTTYTITGKNNTGSHATTIAFATILLTPTFDPVAAICLDGTLSSLPTTSTNSITGTWSPALNNITTTEYTFTPDAGQNATTATMTIEVLPYNCDETKLSNVSCNTTLTAITDKIYAVPFKDADAYRFEVVANGITREFIAPNPVFTLVQLPAGLLYDTTFSIKVAPRVAGVFGAYGAICSITSPEAVTKVNDNLCGTTLATINTPVACKPVYKAQSYFFEITNTNNNTVTNYETNGAYFQFSLLGTAIAKYATTYSIKVKVKIDGTYVRFGDACTITTPSLPTPKVRATICGTTLPLLNSPITCDAVFGAEMYQFEVTNTTNNTSTIYESKTNSFNLSLLKTFASYNTAYSIKVAVKIDGNYGAFGTACTITTPQLPISKIKTAICGTNVNATTLIAADAYFGTQGYRFEVTNNSDNTIQYIDNAGSYFKPSMLKTKMTFNTAYSIRVALKIDGNYGAYGNSCTVYTANARTFTSLSDFNVKTYPNPFDYAFNLDLESNTNEAVYVNVYDMIGKLIESRNIEKSSLYNTSFGNDYAAGIYNVTVSQGSFSKTLRVIKK